MGVRKFSLDAYDDLNKKVQGIIDKPDTPVNFNIEFQIIDNLEKSIITSIINLDIRIEMDGEFINIGHASCFFDYSVENMDDFYKEDKLNLPKVILRTFFSISYSTSRGLLYNNIMGTYLKSVILPVISPVDIVK